MNRNTLLSLILAICLIPDFAQAQQPASLGYFITDLKGEPLTNKNSRITEGSPFFSEEWLKGKVLTNDGKSFENLSLRVNLLENQVHFLSDQQAEMTMKEDLRYVYLTDVTKGYNYFFARLGSSCAQSPKSWFQVLDTGNVWLLKLDSRSVTEIKSYGSAGAEEKIAISVRYYLLRGSDCQVVKSVQEAYTFLANLKPGFAEKPAGKSSPRKLEEDLKTLVGSYNQR
jgi:hypothetical protein